MEQIEAEKFLEATILKPREMTISERITSRRGSSLLKLIKEDSFFSLKFAVKGVELGPYDQYALLQREALTLKTLSSYFDHVLIDSGESQGIAWNLMKWLNIPSALTAAEKLKSESNELRYEKGFIDLFLNLTTKVAELHELGYIHRDIQPDHFLYDGTRSWLLDNTLCGKIDDRDFNYHGALIHYSSPEVAKALSTSPENVPYGILSEIYSMGSVLFFLYTGTTSSQYGSTDYKSLKRESIIDAISKGPVTFESVGARSFSKLEAILRKMMAVDPNARYQNLRQAAESLNDLRNHLS